MKTLSGTIDLISTDMKFIPMKMEFFAIESRSEESYKSGSPEIQSQVKFNVVVRL